MTSKPLKILKRGLTKFLKKIKDRKDALDARFSQKETISLADVHWLDHEVNIIDETDTATLWRWVWFSGALGFGQ